MSWTSLKGYLSSVSFTPNVLFSIVVCGLIDIAFRKIIVIGIFSYNAIRMYNIGMIVLLMSECSLFAVWSGSFLDSRRRGLSVY